MIIDNTIGFAFEQTSIPEAGEKIIWLSDHRDSLSEFIERNKLFSSRYYNEDTNVSKLISILNELAN